jgi:hypothetical protein
MGRGVPLEIIAPGNGHRAIVMYFMLEHRRITQKL